MRIKFVGATLAAAMAVSIAAPVAAQAGNGNGAGAANASHAAEHAVCAPEAPGFARCHAHVRDTTMTGCGRRAVADVSAVADPKTGVAVYDTYLSSASAGWLVFGGTSVAAPVVASLIARAGTVYTAATPYNAAAATLNDVTTGSNGACPSTTPQWCNAGTGWDGPTGLGSPNGLGAF